MNDIRFAQNSSGEIDVRMHLDVCDWSFTPFLSARVSIADYATKLTRNAERFEAWSGCTLVGLVAVYCNDSTRRDAFVTNVSVIPARMRRGIGRRLLGMAIGHVRDMGFVRVTLSVDPTGVARALYDDLGFRSAPKADDPAYMALALDGEAGK